MKDLLEICVFALHSLKSQRSIGGDMFIVFNQNANCNEKGVTALIEQISGMKNGILKAKGDNYKEIQNEADMLYSEEKKDHIIALGSAFTQYTMQKDDSLNIWDDWSFSVPQDSFAMQCSKLSSCIFNAMKNKQNTKVDFETWVKRSYEIWDTIEKHPGTLEFENILQLQQEQELNKLHEKMNRELFKDIQDNEQYTENLIKNYQIDQLQQGIFVKFVDKQVELDLIYLIQQYYKKQQENGLSQIKGHCQKKNVERYLEEKNNQKFQREISSRQKQTVFTLTKQMQLKIINSYSDNGIQEIINEANKNEGLIVKAKQQIELMRLSNESTQTQCGDDDNEQNDKNFQQLLNLLQIKDQTQQQNELLLWGKNSFEVVWNKCVQNIKQQVNQKDIFNQFWQTLVTIFQENEWISYQSISEDINLKKLIFDNNSDFNKYKASNENVKNEPFIQEFITIKINLQTDQDSQTFFHEQQSQKSKYSLKEKIDEIDKIPNQYKFLEINKVFNEKVTLFYLLYQDYIEKINLDKFQHAIQDAFNAKDNQKTALEVKIQNIFRQLADPLQLSLNQALIQMIHETTHDIYIIKNRYNDFSNRLQEFKEFYPIQNNNKPRAFIQKNKQIFQSKEDFFKLLSSNNLIKQYNLKQIFKEINISENLGNFKSIQDHIQHEKNQLIAKLDIFYFEQEMYEYSPKDNQNLDKLSYAYQFLTNKEDVSIGSHQLYYQLNKFAVKIFNWTSILKQIQISLEKRLSMSNESQKEIECKEISSLSTASLDGVKQMIDEINIKINEQSEFLNLKVFHKGKQMLYYFGLFISWKMLCYRYFDIFNEPVIKIENEKQHWFEYYIGKIQSNHQYQSQWAGQEIFKQSINQKETIENLNLAAKLKEQFESSQFQKIFESKNIMKITEKRVFENSDINFILSYIDDPTTEIENTFKLQWFEQTQNKIENQINLYFDNYEQYIIKFEKTIQNFQQKLVKLLDKYSDDIVKSREFFLIEENAQDISKSSFTDREKQDVIYVKSMLLLFESYFNGDQCIQYNIEGKNIKLKNPIKGEQCFVQIKNSNNKTIDLLQYPLIFIKSIQQQITNERLKLINKNEYIKKFKNQEQKYSNSALKIDQIYQKVQTSAKGCSQKCPFCFRKCDLQSSHANHQCQTGHYTRGLKGIIIAGTLSNRTCCQISLDEYIRVVDNEKKVIQKQWGEVVKQNSDWNFLNSKSDPLLETEVNDHLNLQGKFWGKQLDNICSYYSKKFQRNIKALLPNASETVHYVICADDSGSMKGTRWNNQKEAIMQFVQSASQIQQKSTQNFSLIRFSSNAEFVLENVKVDSESSQKVFNQLQFRDGGTDFYEPLKRTFELTQKNYGADRYIVLFYTDGEASYDERIETEYNKLPDKSKIFYEFNAICEDSNPNALLKMCQFFEQIKNGSKPTKLKTNIKPDELTGALVEELDLIHQKIKF